MKYPQFRVWTIVLFFNLAIIILLVILGSVITRKIYSARLIRQTELVLISQGTVIGQVVLKELLQELGPTAERYGRPVAEKASSSPGDPGFSEGLKLDPVQARIDPFRLESIRETERWESPEKVQPDPQLEMLGDDLMPLLLAARESTLTGIRLVDWHGLVVGSTSGGQGLSLAHWQEVALALDGVPASRMYWLANRDPANGDQDRTYRLHVALPLVHQQRCYGAMVLIRPPLQVSLEDLSQIRNQVLMASGIVIIIAVIFSLVTALTISLPIAALIRQVNRYALGQNSTLSPLPRPISQEIGKLSEAFVRMARTIQERSNYILTFARSLSHAFKPPLATIRLRLELLEDESELSPEERQRHLEIIREETARMDRQTTRALEWAKADVVQPGGKTADLDDVLASVTGRYQDMGIDIHYHIGRHARRVMISPEDLETILADLFENARMHGGPGVRVDITARRAASGRQDLVEITLADNGPGISEANREKIFSTFFTTAHQNGGTGLGLPIVRSLLKAYKGEISLLPSEHGAVFLIRLPAR